MKPKLKPVSEQVVVVTGAESGIGRAIAREAAARGATLVLTGWDEPALEAAAAEIRESGRAVAAVAADVADRDALEQVGRVAMEMFGRVDTWINNAGVSIYGRLVETPLDDARRLFETNYWGMVHGSLVAVNLLRERGGALINIGSVVSDRAIPLQGHYSASKHAVKGFTDALRMEIERDRLPISVTLVKPSAIATPYLDHARNLMDAEPSLPPPVYAPEVVARTVMTCAERPVRHIAVGAGGLMLSKMGNWLPRATDRYMEAVVWEQEREDRPAGGDGAEALHEPAPGSGRVHGPTRGRHVRRSSLYTTASLHPVVATFTAVAGLGAALAAIVRLRR